MKHSVIHHPKTKRLQRLLGVPLYVAVGLLESLWQMTAAHAQDGRIGRWSNAEIADWLEYPAEGAQALIDAFVQARFLDRTDDEEGRLLIHDWDDHCPEFVRKRIARAAFDGAADNGSQRRTTADNGRQRRTTADNGGQRPPPAANGCPTDTDTDTYTTGIVEFEIDHKDVSDCERRYAAICKAMVPRNDGDRFLAWQAAVLSRVAYSEHWLFDAVSAVEKGKAKRNPWAYLTRCLREGAKKLNRDFDEDRKRCPPLPNGSPG